MNASAGEITLPVFRLYDGYANQVVLTYFFSDGSSKIFDIDPASPSRLANLSARAFSATGDDVLIGGLVLQGTNFKRVLFRALGHAGKSAGGERDAESDLDLFDGQGVKIATNDDGRNAANAPEIVGIGRQPADDRESAILMPLNVGAYTFIARGVGGRTGVALVEAFRLD